MQQLEISNSEIGKSERRNFGAEQHNKAKRSEGGEYSRLQVLGILLQHRAIFASLPAF
jgi:hypothetical protein